MATFTKDVEEIRQRAMKKIEDGAVTDSYKLDKDKSIMILNEALATEIVCVLRYQHHYFMSTGVHGRGVADLFKEHADEEREHADEIAERIQQLGGKPNFNPGDLVQRSVSQYIEGENLGDMIREDLIAERMVIDVYQRMIEYFGTQDPTTRTLIEHIKSEEEEHASELSDMLFIVNPETGEDEGEDPGTNPLALSENGFSDDRDSRSIRPETHRMPERHSAANAREETESSQKTARHWGNESNIGKQGKGAPVRRSTAPEESGWGNEHNVGKKIQNSEEPGRPLAEGGRRSDDGQREIRGMSKNQKNTNVTNRSVERATPRVARGGDIGEQTGKRKAPGNGNTPGVGGRPMNRRKNESLDINDVAERPNRGGASGGNRSPRILQKNRKSKRAA
jgi:bacterioferritin